MKVLVVYESMFGNTAAIARAVAAGIGTQADVTCTEVTTMPSTGDVDLIVVGGPTHAFGMSRPSTRQDAARQGHTRSGTTDVGLREWLDRCPPLAGMAAAAFDTKIDKPFVPGSAAHTAARRLRRLNGRLVAPPESFRVTDTTGPLAAGETERPQRWGETVAKALRAEQHLV
jgi:hypothetical protein